jgi:hypothetical protein
VEREEKLHRLYILLVKETEDESHEENLSLQVGWRLTGKRGRKKVF